MISIEKTEQKRLLPPEWKECYTFVKEMKRPPGISEESFENLKEFNYHLFQKWIWKVIESGWSRYEIFGCCKYAPISRVERSGLLLGSSMWHREISLVTENEIQTTGVRTKSILTFRKKQKPDKEDDLQFIWEIKIS